MGILQLLPAPLVPCRLFPLSDKSTRDVASVSGTAAHGAFSRGIRCTLHSDTQCRQRNVLIHNLMRALMFISPSQPSRVAAPPTTPTPCQARSLLSAQPTPSAAMPRLLAPRAHRHASRTATRALQPRVSASSADVSAFLGLEAHPYCPHPPARSSYSGSPHATSHTHSRKQTQQAHGVTLTPTRRPAAGAAARAQRYVATSSMFTRC